MIEHLAHLGCTIQNAADKLREGVLLCVTAPGGASYDSNDQTLAERCAYFILAWQVDNRIH